MKKILLFIILASLVLLSLTGCDAKSYSFKKTIDEIESIEIVSAENSLEYTVVKTISETKKVDFLEQFQAIQFRSYYVGDPMSVSGNAVKITYRNGDYEMICHYWAEYVKNGEVYSVRKNCDEKVFNNLIKPFLEEESP